MLPKYLTHSLLLGVSLSLSLGSDVTSSSSRSFQHRQQRSLDTGPSQVDRNYVFPEPKIENVYEAWKPIDYGHPLVDVTIHYAPPELERVRLDGGGPVPSRPTGNNKHQIVFEAAREVAERHTDERLQAEVYNSPRFDKGLNLLPRDTVVAIPSQRRNSFDPLQPVSRHGKQDYSGRGQGNDYSGRGGLRRRKRPEKLKSGIYYVDDPHATFREEHERAQERISDADYEYYYEDPADVQTSSSVLQGVRYVPVSQITTPPTLASTGRPYGEIVNRDFYDRIQSKLKTTPRPRPSKTARRVIDEPSYQEEEAQAFPLGTPYYYYSAQSHPAADNGYQRRQDNVNIARQDTWLPTANNGYDREMDYARDELIYSVKDSGELVLPSSQQTVILPPPPELSSHHGVPTPGPAADHQTSDHHRADHSAPQYNLVYAINDRSSLNVSQDESSNASHGQPRDNVSTLGTKPSKEKLSSEFVYMLCMREVPRYLQTHLCKAPSSSGQLRSSRFSDKADSNNHEAGIRLPPKPQFQFVQDNQYVSSTESVFQERTLAAVDDDNIIDDPFAAPFPFVTSASKQSGPAPVIYSVAQSKVAVYKPVKTTTTTTTAAPSTSTTTTKATTTTVKPFHYQIPTSETSTVAAPPQPPPRLQGPGSRQRPLVYTKRRPGGAQVSRPFEYLSRLSQFLSDRVLTKGRTKQGHRPNRGPPPQLLTRRTQEQS